MGKAGRNAKLQRRHKPGKLAVLGVAVVDVPLAKKSRPAPAVEPVDDRDAAFMRLSTSYEDDKIHAALLAYAEPGETYGYDQTEKYVWSWSFVRDATIIAVANALHLDELPPPRADVRHVPDEDLPNRYVNVVRA